MSSVENELPESLKLHSAYHDGHNGMLEKRGQVLKNWKERYFVLEKHSLKYFTSKSRDVMKGEYIIDANTSISVVNEVVDGRELLFSLSSERTFNPNKPGKEGNRILLLKAATITERDAWIEAIRDTIYNGYSLIQIPEIFPQSISPKMPLFVRYASTEIHDRSIVCPKDALSEPCVMYRPDDLSDQYSLVMMDADFPSKYVNDVLCSVFVSIYHQ